MANGDSIFPIKRREMYHHNNNYTVNDYTEENIQNDKINRFLLQISSMWGESITDTFACIDDAFLCTPEYPSPDDIAEDGTSCGAFKEAIGGQTHLIAFEECAQNGCFCAKSTTSC